MWLPLDASAAPRFVASRPGLAAGRDVFNFSGRTVTNIPVGNVVSLLNTSYTITAEIDVPKAGASGMIVNEGGRFLGYGLSLLKGRPTFTYNFFGLKRTKWQGPELAPGKHTIEFDFRYDGLGEGTLAYDNLSGIGRGGTGTLKVDGAVVATQNPFPFEGEISKITYKVDRPRLTPEDVKKLEAAEQASGDFQLLRRREERRAVEEQQQVAAQTTIQKADAYKAPGGRHARGVCLARNSLTRARAEVRAAPVFHSGMNSQLGKSLDSSSEIG